MVKSKNEILSVDSSQSLTGSIPGLNAFNRLYIVSNIRICGDFLRNMIGATHGAEHQ